MVLAFGRRKFLHKFFESEQILTMVDLARDKQRQRKDLMRYIKRFKEKSLEVHQTILEVEINKVCAEGMLD